MTKFIHKKIHELVRYDGSRGGVNMKVKKFYPSLIPLIRDELMHMIEVDDYSGFQKKCSQTFYDTPLADTESDSAILIENPKVHQWKMLEIKQESYECTTVIEALFNDKYSNACKDLIDLILLKNDDCRWCAVLWQVFFKSGLSAMDKFYDWDEEMEGQMLASLDVMQTYANTLFDIRSDLSEKKYTAIATMVYESKKAIQGNQNPLSEALNGVEELQKWFLNLSFKLSLRKLIHENDYLLSEHRGYKRLVVNLSTILFTLGTANLINKVCTGDWLFFNKTTSLKKAEQVEDSLLLNPIPPSAG